MKKKAVNRSLILLVLTVSFGLFQAWKESKNPFAFFNEKFPEVTTKFAKSNYNRNYVDISSNKKIKQ